jgi:hypothetical protein
LCDPSHTPTNAVYSAWARTAHETGPRTKASTAPPEALVLLQFGQHLRVFDLNGLQRLRVEAEQLQNARSDLGGLQ